MTEDMKIDETGKADVKVIEKDVTTLNKKEEDTASESSSSSKDEESENKAKGESSEKGDDGDKKKKEDDEETAKKKKKEYANWPMKDIKEPHEHDVLYGRGGGTNHHPGNKRYRKMVEERKLDYVNSKRLDKPLVALEIIKVWRSQEPPGRFLKMNEKTGTWNDVGDKKAREKTSQALREKAPELRRKQEEDALIAAGKDPKAIQAARAAAEKRANGAKDRSSLMRAHSLGQDMVPMSGNGGEFALDNFSWNPSQFDNMPPPPGGNYYPAGRHTSYGSQGAGMPPQFPPSRNGSTVAPHEMSWEQRQQSFGSTSSWARLPSGGAPPPPPYGSAPYAMRTNSFGRISREPSQQNPMEAYYPPHPHSLPPPPPPPPHGPGGLPLSPNSSRYLSGGNSGTQKASKEPYALDPALAESWSKDYEKAADVFGNMSAEPWAGTASRNTSSSTSKSGSMPRPDMVKRVTSNQNEDFETKPDLQANRTVKRAALNRDRSTTSNRLKAQYAPGTESNHPSKIKKPSALEDGMRSMSITKPESLDDVKPEPLTPGGRTDTIDRIAREIMAETSSSSMMRPQTVGQGGRTLTEAMLADVMGPSNDNIANEPSKPSSLTATGRSLTEEIMMGEGPPPPHPQPTNSSRPPSISARSLTEEIMMSEPLPPTSGKRPPALTGRTLTEDIMLERLPPAPPAPLPPTNSTRPSALTLAGRGCTAEILAPIGDVHIMPQKKKKQPMPPSRPPAIRTEGRMRTAEYFDLLNEPMGQDDAAGLANPKETHWLQGAM